MPASPGTPSYVANPFAAAAPGAQSGAYANALRSYAPNPFGGGAPQQGAMSPHLSQPIPLDPDMVSAYQQIRADPNASQYEQTVPDIQKLWQTSPTSSIFKPGYQHNPYVASRAGHIAGERDLKQRMAGMSQEEWQQKQMQDYWNANTQIA